MTKTKETSKKGTLTQQDVNAAQAAQEAKARLDLIENYNKKDGETKILLKNVEQADVDAAKVEFEERVKALQAKTYLIADKDNAERVAKFLQHFNNVDAQWSKNLWIGIIQFDKYITDFLTKFGEVPCDLVFDYGPLSFMYTIMMEPRGTGLESAKYMESINEEYSKILEVIGQHVDWIQTEQKHCQNLQDVWSLRSQGFYGVLAPEAQPQPVDQFNNEDAPTEVPTEPVVSTETAIG
jgi:hypothetical protein